MRIHNLYTDASGQSHWRDIEVEWAEQGGVSKMSRRLPATGIIFRETSGAYDLDWHTAPVRQFVVTLSGTLDFQTRAQQHFILKPGIVLLAEDALQVDAGAERIRLAIHVQVGREPSQARLPGERRIARRVDAGEHVVRAGVLAHAPNGAAREAGAHVGDVVGYLDEFFTRWRSG